MQQEIMQNRENKHWFCKKTIPKLDRADELVLKVEESHDMARIFEIKNLSIGKMLFKF